MAHWTTAWLLFVVALLSLLPLIEWNSWWVRLLDFSRLHFLIALVVILGIFFFVWSRRPASWLALLIALSAVGYNGWKLVPYLGIREEMAITVAECPAELRLRVLVANVHNELEDVGELFEVVRAADPDLFLAVETDQWWDERLVELAPLFAEQVQQVAGTRAAFGMHLFSKHPIESSAVLSRSTTECQPYGRTSACRTARSSPSTACIRGRARSGPALVDREPE